MIYVDSGIIATRRRVCHIWGKTQEGISIASSETKVKRWVPIGAGGGKLNTNAFRGLDSEGFRCPRGNIVIVLNQGKRWGKARHGSTRKT